MSAAIQSAARAVQIASVQAAPAVRARFVAAVRAVQNLLVRRAADHLPAGSRAFDFLGGVDNDPVNSR